jgi:Ca2+-binding RTX toxin-like protein
LVVFPFLFARIKGGHQSLALVSIQSNSGASMSNTIYGTDGNDVLTGDAGDNWFMASLGNDSVDGGAGSDTVDFGGGYFARLQLTYAVFHSVSISVDLLIGRLAVLKNYYRELFATFELTSIENVMGTGGDDIFKGNAQDNRLYGFQGNDTFYGSAGNDLLDGGGSIDTADYSTSGLAGGIIANLSTGYVYKFPVAGGPYSSIDTLVDIENVVGTDGLDALRGNGANNRLYGRAGWDSLLGDAGDDWLDGGDGDDFLYGQADNDRLLGQAGKDFLDGGTGNDGLWGGADDDTLKGGDGGNDQLYGEAGNDLLYGGTGNDTLDGGAGVDTLSYLSAPIAGGVDADLGRRTARKLLTSTSIMTAGTTGQFIRIYHTDSYVEGPQGHELGLTGLKVYDTSGRELAFGLRSSIGADGNANGAANPNNSNTALTDALVGGGWNGLAGDAGTVAYANTGFGGAKAYIELDLGSAQAIDSISLWGDAGWATDSRNLRVYVSNTAFSASTTYASLAANRNVARFDLTGAELSAGTSYMDPDAGIGTGPGVDTLVGIENLTGTAMNDRLRGDANANVLSGDAGYDTLVGSGGNDRLDGGAGIDTVSYSYLPVASSVNVDLGNGIASKFFAGTNVSMGGKTGRYIRIYHNDNYVQGQQGHELGLTGMKVYDAWGQDMAFGGRSSIGTDGAGSQLLTVNNSNTALTDANVGGGWNGLAGDAGTVAYANTGVNGAKAYIELDMGSVQAIDSISLWGDAGYPIDSQNLRIYVSNTAFDPSWTNYGNLAADPNVARFDLAGVETSATTTYTDTLVGIENLIGTAMNDTLTGDANDNVLSGGAGDDVLDGRAGIDTADYSLMADGVNADLSLGTAGKLPASTNVSMAGTTGRYIRIYHNDSYVEGPQGHELGLAGMKVYDASGRDVAFGLRSSVGTDGAAGQLLTVNNSNTALTDAVVGGGWNGWAGDPGTVAYVNTGSNGAKAYIQLDLGNNSIAQAIDSISLWGDAGWSKDSKNLRIYVWNTPLPVPTTYASLAASPNVARFDLAGVQTSASTSYYDRLLNIENLTGTTKSDMLAGDANANVLSGGAGNDTLCGSTENDSLDGGAGIDTADYSALGVSVDADLGRGTAIKVFVGTNVGMMGTTGCYIRIYHTDSNVELGLTGMKVYAGGRDVAFGLPSSVGTDGNANDMITVNNSNTALTDTAVGGGWNGLPGDKGNVAYVNTVAGGAKGYIELKLDSPQPIDSISLWGDANNLGDSKNLRVYVSNVAFNTSTTYASLAADPNVARFDLAGVETSATATYTDTLLGIENLTGTAKNDTLTGDANANLLSGSAGSDTLVGGDGNDTLSGGTGNDLLLGGLGFDTYTFQRGGGVDAIHENDSTAGNTDLLQFQGDIASSQLWFRQAGNDLEISVIGTADKAVVQNWYVSIASHVEQIRAGDGKLLLDTQVQNLVQAMAGFAPPAMGQTNLTSQQQAALAPVLAANWH